MKYVCNTCDRYRWRLNLERKWLWFLPTKMCIHGKEEITNPDEGSCVNYRRTLRRNK